MKEPTVRDPVCGMRFNADQARCTHEWEGVVFYFCCERCRETFVADPRRYVQRGQEVAG